MALNYRYSCIIPEYLSRLLDVHRLAWIFDSVSFCAHTIVIVIFLVIPVTETAAGAPFGGGGGRIALLACERLPAQKKKSIRCTNLTSTR